MTTTLEVPYQLGDTIQANGIALTPLFPRTNPFAEYVSSAEGFEHGLLVTEADEDGIVGTLRVKNPLPTSVLLYDGEELLGAKQNRILNMTVLVESGREFDLPVSCVERGRWAWRSRHFAPAGRVSSPRMRQVKAEAMSQSPDRGAQREVWNAVDQQLSELAVSSRSAAISDAYEVDMARRSRLADPFELQAGQCGAILSMNGRWAMDAVSRPEVFARLYPQLLAGYVFDARDADAVKHADPQQVLARVGGGMVSREASAGRGQSLRVHQTGLIAGGLEVDGELIQLSAYSA